MKIIIPNRLNENTRNAMRRCSYFENYDRQSGKFSYIRTLGRGHYPRFHIYVDETINDLILNLHIDQKQVSYEGSKAHSGEYDSEVVLTEGERLKQILNSLVAQYQSQTSVDSEEEKKGFLGRLFG